jgi:adenine phosphoribosyltransferase
MTMRKLEAVRLQLLAVEALRGLRKFMSGKEVLELLEGEGLRITQVDLSRYINGAVLPSPKRSLEILKLLAKVNALGMAVRRALVVDERGVVNVARIAHDTAVLGLAAARVYTELEGVGVDKVLTAAVNGVPLGALAAHVLEAGLCVARQEPDASAGSYIEVRYFAPDPPRYAHLYLPSFALREGDRVLIVDDLLRSGRTLKALAELASLKGAEVVAVFSLLALGSEWRAAVPETASKVVVGLELDVGERPKI